MDIEKLLLEHTSRQMVDHIVQTIMEQPVFFDELYRFTFSENKKLAWRAAWVLMHLHDKSPKLFSSEKLNEIMQTVSQLQFQGVIRSFIYILSSEKNMDYSVDFINLCFDWMLSPKQNPAIQAYCMRVLVNVCQTYPEFKEELITCLENATDGYSKGFMAARKNTLKQLKMGSRKMKFKE